MKTEELDIIRGVVHNALEAVRCLGSLEKKSSMILISQNDLKAYLGGNLEGKLVDAQFAELYIRLPENRLVFPVTAYDAVHDAVHAGVHQLV